MAEYKHGAYGVVSDSISEATVSADTVPVYFGTAPVNLVVGEDYPVNVPVRIATYDDALALIGYSDDWGAYTLCEAVSAHFSSGNEPIGPIYVVNVLDPAIHRAQAGGSVVADLSVGPAYIADDRAIIATVAVADGETAYVEGTDYTVAYEHASSRIVIRAVEDGSISGTATVTYSKVDPSAVTASDVIGGVADDGTCKGISAVALVYPENFDIPNILAAPGWSEKPEVYSALVAASSKINGHWDAFAVADIPLSDGDTRIDSIKSAIAWKAANSYTSERSAVCWPRVAGVYGDVYHLSTLYCAETQRIDAGNDGVPHESCSNKPVMAVAHYFGEASKSRTFDQRSGNSLNEHGITTAVPWAGRWVLWGAHTAAYEFGADIDPRAVFAPSMRMLYHITNSFQHQWSPVIDEPMTRPMLDMILAVEQEKLDALVADGALIGDPKVGFSAASNDAAHLIEGDFRWDLAITPAPPIKSATVVVSYTTAGFSAYAEEGGE